MNFSQMYDQNHCVCLTHNIYHNQDIVFQYRSIIYSYNRYENAPKYSYDASLYTLMYYTTLRSLRSLQTYTCTHINVQNITQSLYSTKEEDYAPHCSPSNSIKDHSMKLKRFTTLSIGCFCKMQSWNVLYEEACTVIHYIQHVCMYTPDDRWKDVALNI